VVQHLLELPTVFLRKRLHHTARGELLRHRKARLHRVHVRDAAQRGGHQRRHRGVVDVAAGIHRGVGQQRVDLVGGEWRERVGRLDERVARHARTQLACAYMTRAAL
jgi:hypothetical protein